MTTPTGTVTPAGTIAPAGTVVAPMGATGTIWATAIEIAGGNPAVGAALFDNEADARKFIDQYYALPISK